MHCLVAPVFYGVKPKNKKAGVRACPKANSHAGLRYDQPSGFSRTARQLVIRRLLHREVTHTVGL